MSTISDYKTPPFDLFSTTSNSTPVNSDATAATMCGSKWRSGDGREYVLVQNGGTALAAGKAVQGPAAVSNFASLSPATSSTTGYSAAYPIVAAIGGKQIQIATSSTAALVNRFQGGYLTVVSGTGLGQTLKIASNSAAATTAAMVVNVEDQFTTATDSTSRYTLSLNQNGTQNGTDNSTDGVLVTPATTLTGTPLGVTSYPIPASTATVPSYGFVQVRGPVACLASGTVALGVDIAIPSGTAGAHSIYTPLNIYTPASSLARIGTTIVAATNATYNLINVQL